MLYELPPLRFMAPFGPPVVAHDRLTQPLYLSRVAAGFPSPADDYVEKRLDLNDLIEHKEATFFCRVQGDSMIGEGIHNGDLLVVDRALEPESGKVVIAILDGEFTVKRLQVSASGKASLHPANPAYPVIEIRDGQALEIWGVVIHVIHSF